MRWMTWLRVVVEWSLDAGQLCMTTGFNCGGDNRDTLYIRGPYFRLPDNDTVVYVVGVNHAATGNAHYSNVAVFAPSRNLGLVAVDDSTFGDSAVGWAAGTGYEAAAAKGELYVTAFARHWQGRRLSSPECWLILHLYTTAAAAAMLVTADRPGPHTRSRVSLTAPRYVHDTTQLNQLNPT